MGEIHNPAPVLLIVAAVSRHEAALEWGRARCAAHVGTAALVSEPFDFTETDYYAATMGSGLKKQFFAFERLVDPGSLADIKCQTNLWEAEYAALGRHVEPRPLNLDPGYITPAKLVLASTKDHAHRLYLGEGIHGEVTLVYHRGKGYEPWPWTYPDYAEEKVRDWFATLRSRSLH